MSALTGQTIANSYEQVLHVDRDGGGNTSSLVSIKDGDNGTTFCASMNDASTSKSILSIDGSHANGTALFIDNSAGDGDVSVEFQLGGTTTWYIGIEDGDTTDGDVLKIGHDATIGNDERLTLYATSTVVNEAQTDIDFRVEGNGDANLLFCDAGNDRIGISTNSPAVALDIRGEVNVGVDGTGHDVKFFGDTPGSFMLWDYTDDALELTDSSPIKIGDSADMLVYHNGTDSYITNAQGALKIATETSGIVVTIGHTTSETTVADNLNVTGAIKPGAGGLWMATPVLLSDPGDTNIDALVEATHAGRTCVIPSIGQNSSWSIPTPTAVGVYYHFIYHSTATEAQNVILSTATTDGTVDFRGSINHIVVDPDTSASNAQLAAFGDGNSNDIITIATPSSIDLHFLAGHTTYWYVWGTITSATKPVFSDS